ncbi:FAD-dependent monooxygenase [Orrella daihaiensis]|uniref:FAD-dependent monooxygenase n=1 Tax=Orrella daihaiensis TaxID=2782176 RepID=A0ABY4APM0_9BURK|nr:FAD-dependent monooxygenase [Orrella daihaiensis]UOD51335.1 FAD-dependent monooxygenase [Orrella daihaiensis]
MSKLQSVHPSKISDNAMTSPKVAAPPAIEFDLGIVGGGPTGSALALLLARLAPDPARIVLFQSETVTRWNIAAHEDNRVIALNEGTRVLFDDLDVWPHDATAIQTIHVSQRGRLGRTLITREEFNVPALGYVVRYSSLHTKLLQAAQAIGVTVIQGKASSVMQTGDAVSIRTDKGHVSVALAVRADGMNHGGAPDQYRQVALLGQAWVTQPKPGWAYERFTRSGPFAVLPHPDGDGSQSIVWCCEPERGRAIEAMELRELEIAMNQTFGDRLGRFMVKDKLKAYPLYQSLDPNPVNGRIVNIGNAAQTLHPVAGQGLNLGIRDVATLSHCLRDWIAYPHRNPARTLDIYQNLRARDRTGTVKLTELMSKAFTTGWAPFEHAAGLSLWALDAIEPLRAPLARHLMQGLRQ